MYQLICILHTISNTFLGDDLTVLRENEIVSRNIPLLIVSFISIVDDKDIRCLYTRYD